MQRGRNDREESASTGGPFDSFRRFGGLGHERSLMSHIFEGRDPFDDPFFTRPSGSMFGSSLFGSGVPFGDSPHVIRSNLKGPIIEELHMEEEEEEEEEEEVDGADVNKDKRKAKMNIAANKHPHVEHPDDKADAETKSKAVIHSNVNKKFEGTTPEVRSVSFQKVTYGGVNGAYYTATTTRSTGNDGVVLEDCKQADKTTGQATHRISRGIHDKGHSLTRKLTSDGKVDTMQTLHNLNEDELTGFEQAWKGNAEGQFHGLHEGFNFNSTAGSSGGGWRGNSWLIPVRGLGFSEGGRRMGGHSESGTRPSSGGRPKKVVTINIE
ncbi:uncharacterized protein LOC127802303 isoform X2 [Diospyros lotus]|uniref:uncharacterized protein LOC127802303 isoform X2 n=1 Tax=Diospyros lotus TaxID=55363 RepID=UPI002259FE66|nr:uncharacterized protein LOC127802303 isoform X2 [Diospyros lotus]